MSYRLRGVVLPDDEERDLYVAGDRITFEPLGGAEPVVDGGWLLPGLVDVHNPSRGRAPRRPAGCGAAA
jgi:imidazolonepropionase-like amidohydrolase